MVCVCLFTLEFVFDQFWGHYHDGIEQTQGCMISFELTKPNQSNQALLVPWCWSSTFFVNSGFDPEFRSLGVTSVANSQSHAEKEWKN